MFKLTNSSSTRWLLALTRVTVKHYSMWGAIVALASAAGEGIRLGASLHRGVGVETTQAR